MGYYQNTIGWLMLAVQMSTSCAFGLKIKCCLTWDDMFNTRVR